MLAAKPIINDCLKNFMRFINLFILLILLTLPISIKAQATVFGDQTQKNGKTLISLPVTVSDRDGRYVTGLEKKNFTVYQNGVEQKISAVTTFDEPISVALLLDTSGSTKDSLKNIKDAAADFIKLLNPQDKCSIVVFNSEIKILSPLTTDHQKLQESLDQVQTADKEGSLVFDAVSQTAQNAFGTRPGRKVIVLLSDGKDYGSKLTKRDLTAQLEESDVSIYSIFYESGAGFNKMKIAADGSLSEAKQKPEKPKKPQKKKKNYSILIPMSGDVLSDEEVKLAARAADVQAVSSLQELSDTTAGRFYQSDTPKLGSVFKKISEELKQQYRLEFYSTEKSNGANNPPIIIKVDKADSVVHIGGKYHAAQL